MHIWKKREYGVEITTYALPITRNAYHDKHFPWLSRNVWLSILDQLWALQTYNFLYIPIWLSATQQQTIFCTNSLGYPVENSSLVDLDLGNHDGDA